MTACETRRNRERPTVKWHDEEVQFAAVGLFLRSAVEALCDEPCVTLVEAAARLERTTAEVLRSLRAAGLQHKRLRSEDGELRYHVPLTFVDKLASMRNSAA